jgi:hypothetical protein
MIPGYGMAFETDAIFRSKKPSAEGYEAETVTLAGDATFSVAAIRRGGEGRRRPR